MDMSHLQSREALIDWDHQRLFESRRAPGPTVAELQEQLEAERKAHRETKLKMKAMEEACERQTDEMINEQFKQYNLYHKELEKKEDEVREMTKEVDRLKGIISEFWELLEEEEKGSQKKAQKTEIKRVSSARTKYVKKVEDKVFGENKDNKDADNAMDQEVNEKQSSMIGSLIFGTDFRKLNVERCAKMLEKNFLFNSSNMNF
uniref:Nucleoporin GLE1 n=1 Tax=Caenorhabditis tropicalis TaxID=1561998 RepID=A0A1I7TPL7_9PELO